jgi:hypothetical protein
MCKEMQVILVNKVVDPERTIGKNGGPRRRRGTRGPKFRKSNLDIVTWFYVSGAKLDRVLTFIIYYA